MTGTIAVTLTFQPSIIVLLIVNAQNEWHGNLLRRNGQGMGWSNGSFRRQQMQRGGGNVQYVCGAEIEYVCVRARDNDACEEREMEHGTVSCNVGERTKVKVQ